MENTDSWKYDDTNLFSSTPPLPTLHFKSTCCNRYRPGACRQLNGSEGLGSLECRGQNWDMCFFYFSRSWPKCLGTSLLELAWNEDCKLMALEEAWTHGDLMGRREACLPISLEAKTRTRSSGAERENMTTHKEAGHPKRQWSVRTKGTNLQRNRAAWSERSQQRGEK